MRNSGTLLVAVATAACLAACQSGGSEQTTDANASQSNHQFGSIGFEPCSLASLDGAQTSEARCGSLQVAEDPAHPNGRQITLNIAWSPTPNGSAELDPMFFIAGGPGQSATEVAAQALTILSAVQKQRDIIFIDQRGTGKSNKLDCRGSDGEPLATNLAMESTIEGVQAYARQCAEGLVGRADPRFYTTTDAVRDMDAVRAALGVEAINLFGVSYGTRVAQQYAATYPEHTRSVVLDSVAPNELVVGAEFANTLEDALTLQASQCREIDTCAARYPTDIREQLRSVMASLREAPVEVDYRDPRTNLTRRDLVTADTVGSLALMYSYMPQTAALLPLTIDEAAHGRYAPLMSLMKVTGEKMQDSISVGMRWSVVCAEDFGRYVPDPKAAATIMGSELSEQFFAACAEWPHAQAPDEFHKPFASDVPVLLLSGELDPVTPPRYGDQIAANLPNGRHLILKGQGHSVSGIGCTPKLIGQFLETADAKALDVTCLDTLSYVPPFVSFNGWSP